MGLLKKLSILAGALLHQPLAPRPEKVKLDEAGQAPSPPPSGERREHSDLEAQEPGVVDTDRVADLLAKKRQEGQD